ncbi:hypothetical protein NPIL_399311 [Nephila pilipes]|uniref:Uncharacterized protein n=1 Tax=Nephila pilipes TaxID=299642 RepID=A0A8X6MYI4_NEPPI|nr:hypothetical protein NPIL_399311 [Nephila pilipes]
MTREVAFSTYRRTPSRFNRAIFYVNFIASCSFRSRRSYFAYSDRLSLSASKCFETLYGKEATTLLSIPSSLKNSPLKGEHLPGEHQHKGTGLLS